jgi:hypothetical protein
MRYLPLKHAILPYMGRRYISFIHTNPEGYAHAAVSTGARFLQ